MDSWHPSHPLTRGEILLGLGKPAGKPCPKIREDWHFPEELRERRQWVGYVLPSKEPINPRTGKGAQSTNPATWGTCSEAADAVLTYGLAGLGFVFSAEDPYVGIDFDHCRDAATGEIEPKVWADVKRLNSYTEVSASGTGLHIICTGVKPGPACKGKTCEMYSENRYFALTGRLVVGVSCLIGAAGVVVDDLYFRLVAPQASEPRSMPRPTHIPVGDEELFQRIHNSKFAAKFNRLWAGDASEYPGADGKPDQSRADLALCGILSIFTGDDPLRLDRLFRDSALYRAKWDERHGALTYGDRTIAYCLRGTRS